MAFLVILFGLIVTATWLKDVDRFDDGWFSRYQQAMRGLVARTSLNEPVRSTLGILCVYLGLLVLTVILDSLAKGLLYGLVTMALHLLILLFAMDRIQPGKLANDFLSLWHAGDRSGCVSYLNEELNLEAPLSPEQGGSLVRQFKRLLAYRSFERMFMMYTLYVLAGPSGVVVAYVSYQLRAELCSDGDKDLASRINLIIAVFEWIPLRLLATTFCLVGDFSQCFSQLRKQFWRFDVDGNNSELLAGWARCALAESGGCAPCEAADDAACNESAMAYEIESLRGLLERSQLVWLVSVALITLITA